MTFCQSLHFDPHAKIQLHYTPLNSIQPTKSTRSRPYPNSIAKMKFASINSEGNGTYKLNHNMPVLTRQCQIGHQKMQLLHDFPDILHSLMNKQTALTKNNLGKCRCGLTPCICGGYPSTTKAKGPKCRCGIDPCICGFR